MIKQRNKPLVAMMAGGTGGHIFPGLAVAQSLVERNVEIFWLGAHKSMESELVPKHGYLFEAVKISGLRGKGIVRWLFAPLMISLAFWSALRIFIKKRPALVIGIGGFVAGPGGLAAYVANIPLLIHEQNAIAGLTNRLLAPLSERVLTGFPNVLPSKRTRHVGNPVRFSISPQPQQSRGDCLHLLVIGGSLGARIFNEVVPQTLALLGQAIQIKVKQQCGKGNAVAVARQADSLGVALECFDFSDAMDELYCWSDLILCRSGAMTVAEVTVSGRASIMVPFPYAVGDHQTANAEYLSINGAALLIKQKDFSANKLARTLEEFVNDRQRLATMANNARALALPDSTKLITDLCFEAGKL